MKCIYCSEASRTETPQHCNLTDLTESNEQKSEVFQLGIPDQGNATDVTEGQHWDFTDPRLKC